MTNGHTHQKFIFKIHSTRLRKSRWNLELPIPEAMKNHEIIPIADSTMLRWIDELNGIRDYAGQVRQLKADIRAVRKSQAPNKKSQLKKLYTRLQTLQFVPDYLCIIMDKDSDYDRTVSEKGFQVNGISYVRLLATNGGVKNRVIVFTSKRLAPELKKRLANGRNLSLPHVPAKFGSYEALSCSSTIPVSDPAIIIVPDCEVAFVEDIIRLDDSDSEEPRLTYEKDFPIHKNASDGFGLMLPKRAAQWGEELGLDYIPSGLCTRPYAWGKGILAAFDFHAFAREIAGTFTVIDAWGTPRSILDADVILTTSMVKLWDSYQSLEHYLDCCHSNHYTFGITKVCPKELEQERNLNYQFLQSCRFSDEDLEALVLPTILEMQEVLGENPMKSVLFLRGTHITEETAELADFNYIRALQIDNSMADDPYVCASIFRMLKKRIDEAKTGVLKVHGNYQIACGDPYALCQSIFKLPVTGLLKKGEFYSQYWIDRHVTEVTAFRAPMTCHNNIRRMFFPASCEQRYWYRYIHTMLLFNSWDTSAEAMNGEDFDGDMNLTTDNPILKKNHRILPAILCIQRKAEKKVITEELLIQSNKDSFGDDIGTYTNGITSQFEVQSHFPEDSREYKELEYRIMCGQLFQQNAIDKTKGIIARPRPRYWFDYYSNRPSPEDSSLEQEQKVFRQKLIAEKKPYFMQYIYPQVQKECRKYKKDTDKKCRIEFSIGVEELKEKSCRSEEEEQFLSYYESRMPAGIGPCVINRICLMVEQALDQHLPSVQKNSDFDYSILMSGTVCHDSQEYKAARRKITALYKQYTTTVSHFKQQAAAEGLKPEDIQEQRSVLLNHFRRECDTSCPDIDMLSDIVLELCYTSVNSRQFAWDMCGEQFAEHLLKRNNYIIHYPVRSPAGTLTYLGETFEVRQKKLTPPTIDV